MALPPSTETERTLYLRGLVEATSNENFMAWPKPTDADMLLFARIISFYNAIDFALRYVVSIMDRNGMLSSPWAGKTAKLSMYRINQAIRSSSIWNDGHIVGFEQIELHRSARNLIAHFIARRFPTEDAFIFMTMSASDFEQVHGVLPEADSMLFSVVDASQMEGIIPILQGLVSWCSKLPGDLSNPVQT